MEVIAAEQHRALASVDACVRSGYWKEGIRKKAA